MLPKRIYLLLLLCLFVFSGFFSQNSKSLRKLVVASRNPIKRINTYVLIAKNCDNYDSAVFYIRNLQAHLISEGYI